jgi:hypothetical protein
MEHEEEILNKIELIKNNKMNTCIFGAGQYGMGMAYDILKSFGITIACYCDNDSTLWGKTIRDDVICVSPNCILQKGITACFVFIGSKVGTDEVLRQIEYLGLRIIITLSELIGLSKITDNFLNGKIISNQIRVKNERLIWTVDMVKKGNVHNENKKECAVFTCITGDYDHVNEPKFYSNNCDYYLLSDKRPERLKGMQWIDIDAIVPEKVVDNIRRNRFCKINAPYIFSEYKYSIYMDGTIKIFGDLNKYINKIGKSGIAIFRHPERNCIYSEAVACAVRNADNFNGIYTQVTDYLNEGMPYHFGLFECTILIRDNSNPICRKIMLDWWNEVFNRSYRDQLSFTYCLWKNELKYEDIGILGEDYRISLEFKRVRNHRYKY